MNKAWLIVCSWVALANTVCSSLKVTGNEALNNALKDFPNGAIPYGLAHFGVIPYGVTILGLAHFDPENEHGCKEGKLIPYNSDDITPILVVRRNGGCEFITKTKNAQAIGASLLLIVDDKGDDVTHLNAVAFRDGSKAKIASLIIDQKAGEAIISALSSRETSVAQSVIVQFALELNKANKVDLDIILGVSDKSAFQFLSAFKDMAQDLDSKHFNMNYTFHVTSCKGWEPSLIDKHCLNNIPELCVIAGADGKPLIETTLLLKCALENDDFKNNFMAFSERYMEDCLDDKDSQYSRLFECAQATVKAFSPKFKGAAGDCYQKNFQTGKILQADSWAVQNISEHPVVYVNNKSIDGSLSADNIFQAVCFAYNKPPKTCAFTKGMYMHSKALTDAVREVHTTESRFITFNVVIVILVVVVASVFFYYLFKRTYKKMISTQVDGMIKDSIDKYRRMGIGNETEL